MAKRELQSIENRIVVRIYERIMNSDYKHESLIECSPLRTCNARVYVYPSIILLQSYDTIVAIIDRKRRILIDILRYVYVYTNTSAQHISKFAHDYLNFFDTFYRWKEV